jgi:hypothetical protein
MHAVVRLDSLLPEIDSCTSPMYVAMIHWNEDHVLGEYVYL